MEVIYSIKAGDYTSTRRALELAQTLIHRGADGLILGCTELSLIAKEEKLGCPLFDPLSVLAEKAVERARGNI